VAAASGPAGPAPRHNYPMTTVVAFHAHPDDEVLLTGGTIAKLSAEGHRVVIVMATDGFMGATTKPGYGQRLAELDRSATILGAARVVCLGYADSGHGPLFFEDPPDRSRFARADLDEAAARLLAVIREERAQLLLSYEPGGHYGHRDHVRVHQVAARAAEMADGIRVLEAAVPAPALRLLFSPRKRDVTVAGPPRRITHRVSVRKYARGKRAALAAHVGRVSPGEGRFTPLAVLARLPLPLFALVAGHEWFAESAKGGTRSRSSTSAY
jgi:LmbE family N-acetylglucosaminyl deacetylase